MRKTNLYNVHLRPIGTDSIIRRKTKIDPFPRIYICAIYELPVSALDPVLGYIVRLCFLYII